MVLALGSPSLQIFENSCRNFTGNLEKNFTEITYNIPPNLANKVSNAEHFRWVEWRLGIVISEEPNYFRIYFVKI